MAFLCLPIHGSLSAQTKVNVDGTGSAQAIVHSGELPPLWFVSQQEGRWNNLQGNQILGTVGADINWKIYDAFNVIGEAEIDHSDGYDETYLHTGFLGIRWKSFSLKAGKHSFNPIFTEPNSGSGSYIFGINHRPFSRVTLEIPDYSPVPFTGGRLEVRGGISQGWLSDQPYSGDVLLHEKYAYLRWNGNRWKPYAGLNHSSLFGGNYPNSQNEIPVDFIATVFGKGSEKIDGGEATNAAGAHMGLYDFGTYYNSEAGPIHFYYQIPFSDGSGMLFWQGNTDHILGINWQPVKIDWLSNLTFEWIQTTYQSGNGMPDPYLNGIIFPKQVDDKNAFVQEKFGILVDEPLSLEGFKDILEDELNHGNDFGGRDGYMNNGLYPSGWARRNHIMGSPFNLTRDQLKQVKPGMNFNHRVGIKNDRFKALHLGGKGNISENISWEMRLTWTRNFGTYFEQYPGRYTWNEVDDYWFKGGRDQWYTLLGVGWKPDFVDGLKLNASFAWDAGDIYHSSGVKIGVIYQLF
ncbi:capsule assembly Wzi family protein [Marinilabilia rubra]|uniref:capsule assembly Wzi family protein n=1 Tax=Marinilabilia rubra TaxID=2162893 RepID=UPI001E3A82A2|nr:capsule assembly Wzi family protein [Marinilabilia rubra]